ncbi:MAG: hypothetical protein KME21_03780 [Desmonostoc vinosum HA7617-LM4]|jgi:gas vesicle protein|nr:hypothetical protein [Desmonostoc vinosum HA7617-LM4]
MSQQNGFASGFFVGAVVGSVFGGVVGALIASRSDLELAEEQETEFINGQSPTKKVSTKRRQMRASESDTVGMETARRSLEDKIAQLNATIDEVRKQLGNVNGGSSPETHD